MGDGAASSGITAWSKIRPENSERDVQRLVKKQNTTLAINISEMNVQGNQLPWINPRDWFQFIISHGLLYMMSGLRFEERHLVGTQWNNFWRRFQQLQPDYDLFFMDNIDFTHTIGLYWHGDEGRTLKRSGLMVTSVQSVLGEGFASKRLKRPPGENDAGKLHVNFRGNTLLTRFILSVITKSEYQNNPEYFHDAMDGIATALRDLLDTGLVDEATGERWRFAVVGIKGDMAYLQKLGKLRRSWNTGLKRGQRKTAPRGVCHLCLAGTSGYPCEDTNDRPVWLPTLGAKPPWDSAPGVIRILPHCQSDPGSYFQPDLWHCLHLGIAKSFISSVIQVALEVVPASSNDARFHWLTVHYQQWCKTQKVPCHTSKISACLVSYGEGPGASGSWSKGALTSNLARWLGKLLQDIPDDSQTILSRSKAVVKQFNEAISYLYNAPLFLERHECDMIHQRGMFFLQSYTRFAEECYNGGRAHLFPLFPKLHSVHHTFHALKVQSLACNFGMNPLTVSCQLDEDAIGKASSLSRRVNLRLVHRRTLERHLIACKDVWVKHGLLK